MEILLVDDDGAADFETDYFLPAITAAGKTVATWERGAQKLTSADLAHFRRGGLAMRRLLSDPG